MALPLQFVIDWTLWIASGVGAVVGATLVALWFGRRLQDLRDELDEARQAGAAGRPPEPGILEAILRTMDDGVVVAGPDGRCIVCNPAARRIIGREPADVSPDAWPETYRVFGSDMRTPLRKDDLVFLAALRGEEPNPVDVYFAHDGGEGVHARATARPVRGSDGTLLGAALVLRDISEGYRGSSAREALIEDLERRNRELERFTYTVAHELRSPLVTIKGFLNLLRTDVEKGDPQRLTLDMDRIGEAVESMGALLEDLLELSRAGVVVDAAGTVDLDDLTAEVLRVLVGPIERAGAEVVVAADLPSVRGDRRRLSEVFQNLVENALKFMGDQPSPRIEIDVREEESYTVCCVRDNGIGIAEEDRERVFRVFERVDSSAEGSGVGLALVKGIVEAHRGSVWVESGRDGVGSTFCFSLPRVSDDV